MAVLRKWVTETLLWLAAALGLVCIVLVILAYSYNISLILFRTGSMEPTISAGDVAVVRQIDASDVQVGDILTIDRAGELPVTHRVIAIEEGSTPEERVIRMQGDANSTEDPYPYTITEAGRTLFSVPGLANAIHQMSNPYVLGTATLSATVLVLWAFWPRPPTQRTPRTSPPVPRHARTTTSTSGGTAGKTTARISAVLIAAGSLIPLTASPAYSSELVVEEHHSTYLTLTSMYVPEAGQNLGPGYGVIWDLEIASHAPSPGRLDTYAVEEGTVPLQVSAATCSRQWSTPPGRLQGSLDDALSACPGEYETHAEQVPIPHSDEPLHLGHTALDDTVWYRLIVTVPSDVGQEHQNSEAMVQLRLHAFEEELALVPEPQMPPAEPTPPVSAAPPVPDTSDHPPEPEAAAIDSPSTTPPSQAQERRDELATTGRAILGALLGALILLAVGSRLYRRGRKPVLDERTEP